MCKLVVISVFVLSIGLVVPVSGDDAPHIISAPPLYVGIDNWVVLLEPDDETTRLFEHDLQPPFEQFSEEERAYFAEWIAPLGGVRSTSLIRGGWGVPGGRVLVQVDHERCSNLSNWDNCAGVQELWLVDSAAQSLPRRLVSLDYHYQPLLSGWRCDSRTTTRVHDVYVSPTGASVIVQITAGSSCTTYQTKSWGLLLDITETELSIRELPFGEDFIWSPDSAHFAFNDRSVCADAAESSDANAVCPGTIAIYEPGAVNTLSLPVLRDDRRFIDFFEFSWADNHTLVVRQVNEPVPVDFNAGYVSDSYLYNVETGVIEALPSDTEFSGGIDLEPLQAVFPDTEWFDLGDNTNGLYRFVQAKPAIRQVTGVYTPPLIIGIVDTLNYFVIDLPERGEGFLTFAAPVR